MAQRPVSTHVGRSEKSQEKVRIQISRPDPRFSPAKAAKYFDRLAWFRDDFEFRPTGAAGNIDFSGAVLQELSVAEIAHRVTDHLPLWVELSTGSKEAMTGGFGVDIANPDAFAVVADELLTRPLCRLSRRLNMALVELSDRQISIVKEALQYSKRAKSEGSAPRELKQQNLDEIDELLAQLRASGSGQSQ